jgi:hypothetical protein
VAIVLPSAGPIELIAEHVLLPRRDEAFQQEHLASLERAQHPAARFLAEERRDAGLGVERAELVAERARPTEPRADGGEARDLRGERWVPPRLLLLLGGGRRRGPKFTLEPGGGDALRARGRGRRRERGEEAAPSAAASRLRGEERRGVETKPEVRGRARRGLLARGHGAGEWWWREVGARAGRDKRRAVRARQATGGGAYALGRYGSLSGFSGANGRSRTPGG